MMILDSPLCACRESIIFQTFDAKSKMINTGFFCGFSSAVKNGDEIMRHHYDEFFHANKISENQIFNLNFN